MNSDKILGYCDQIDVLVQQIREETVEPVPPDDNWTLVPIDGDLQLELDRGGALELESAGTWEKSSGFSFNVDSTHLRGLGSNKIVAPGGHAFRFGLGYNNAVIEDVELASVDYDGSVCRLGLNSQDQTELINVPHNIRIARVNVLSHRGKRAFEVNAADVVIEDCNVRDLYAPSKQDSQAIFILNTPGNIHIRRCHLEAAAENIMVGGDEVKIPDCRPTNILIENCQLTKPIEWRDNTAIPVKNLFELKDGHNVTLRNCELWNCWKSGQDGYALMLTPANGGSVRNARVENCIVHDVGGIVNVTGTDASGVNPQRTQVSIIGGEYRTNKVVMSGSGRFMLANRGPEWLIVEGCTIAHEGSAFCDLADDKKPIDLLRIVDSTWNYGSYGIRIGGANHGDNTAGIIGTIEISGNTITGAHSLFKDRYPNNTYL